MGDIQCPLKEAMQQVPHGKYTECKEELRKTLGLKHYVALYQRINGKIEPSISEAKKIAEILKKYGVTIVW